MRCGRDGCSAIHQLATDASGTPPVDPGRDVSRGAMLADNEAVTTLLSTLVPERGTGYFCTFAVARPFHALTDMARDLRGGTRRLLGRQAP